MKDLCSTRMQRLPGNIGILPRTGTTKSGISYPFLPIAHIPPGQLGAGLGFWWQSWLEWSLCSQTFWVIQPPCGLKLTGSVKKPGYVKRTKPPKLAKAQIKKEKSHSSQVILQLHTGQVFVWVQVQTWFSRRLSPGLPHRSGRTSPGPRSPQPPAPEWPSGQQGVLKHTWKRGKCPWE